MLHMPGILSARVHTHRHKLRHTHTHTQACMACAIQEIHEAHLSAPVHTDAHAHVRAHRHTHARNVITGVCACECLNVHTHVTCTRAHMLAIIALPHHPAAQQWCTHFAEQTCTLTTRVYTMRTCTHTHTHTQRCHTQQVLHTIAFTL